MGIAREAVRFVAPVVLAGMAEGEFLIDTTVGKIHRGPNSHDSIGFNSELVDRGLAVAMEPYQDGPAWGMVHNLDHHAWTDTSGKKVGQIAENKRFRDKNKVTSRGHTPFPEFYDGLDPFARQIPFETAVEMGELVLESIGGHYKPRVEFSPQESAEAAADTPGSYFYEPLDQMRAILAGMKGKPITEFSLSENRFFIRDAHAPDLLDGDWKVFVKEFLPRYRGVEQLYDNDQLAPESLRRDPFEQALFEKRKALLIASVVGHTVVGAGARAGLRYAKGDTSPVQIAKNALIGGTQGAAAQGVGASWLISGGIVTNLLGHLGADVGHYFKTGEIIPHKNGTVATNANVVLAWLFRDEPGWQENHHLDPGAIAYAKRFAQAPLGHVLQFAAKHNIVIHEKEPIPDHLRTDKEHPTVLMMQAERRRSIEAGLVRAA